jgi:hypothetical protein
VFELKIGRGGGRKSEGEIRKKEIQEDSDKYFY